MSKYKLLGFIGLILVLSSCLISCSSNQKKNVVIRLAYSAWPPDMIPYLAQEKGFFEEEGLNVELLWINGISDANKKRLDEQFDIWTSTLLDFVKNRFLEEINESRLFLIQDFSYGADAIIVNKNSGIKKITDLKGKKVALEKGTVGEFLFNIIIDQADMDINSIEIVNLNYDEIWSAVKKGEVAAGVSYEPEITFALADGAEILVDSSQEVGVIIDVYLTSDKFLQNNPDIHERFAKAIIKAINYLDQYPDESYEILSKRLNLPVSELRESFSKLKLADMDDNRRVFRRDSGLWSIYSLLRKTESYLDKQGIVNNNINDLNDLIYTKIINNL